LDLTAGAVANAAFPARRWYHRPGSSSRKRYSFIGFHLVYIWLVAWLYLASDWVFAIWISALLLLGMFFVENVSNRNKPAAAAWMLIASLAASLLLSPAPEWSWFVPVLFVKLVSGHLVPFEAANLPPQ
jgi:hypothetical protein